MDDPFEDTEDIVKLIPLESPKQIVKEDDRLEYSELPNIKDMKDKSAD